ncbi:MAG: hypothetical protein AAFU70_04740, partial [Planctomycetota bacterium]
FYAATLNPNGVVITIIIDEGFRRGTAGDVAIGLVAAVLVSMPGLISWVFSHRIARGLVPVRTAIHCPGCGYRIEGLEEARCPECGLELPAEFMGAGRPDQGSEPDRAAHLIKMRDTLTPVIKIIGFALMLVFGLVTVTVGVNLYHDIQRGWADPEDVNVMSIWVAIMGVLTLVHAGMFMFGFRAARLFMPPARTKDLRR